MNKDAEKFNIQFTVREKILRSLFFGLVFILVCHRVFAQELPKTIQVKNPTEVKVIQLQLENLSLKQKILDMELRERLETFLRTEGVQDKNFNLYKYDPETFTFILRDKP